MSDDTQTFALDDDMEKSITLLSKQLDGDGPGEAVFEFATEGDEDKDGDVFQEGSIRLEREKAAFMSFQHGFEPRGTWTLSRNGAKVIGTVKFLSSAASQEMREFLDEMGESAQFSFRFRPLEYAYRENGKGLLFKDVIAYEASPVFIGAGNGTRLTAIKSFDKESEMDRRTDRHAGRGRLRNRPQRADAGTDLRAGG